MTEPLNNSSKRLYRSKQNQMIAGVAAGFAEYFDIDPTLVRVLFVLLFFASAGFAALLYIILAIVMPVDPKFEDGKKSSVEDEIHDATKRVQGNAQNVVHDIKTTSEKHGNDARLYVALALIIIGFIALSNTFLPMFGIRWMHIWPVVLIIFGLLLIVKRN